MINDSLKSADLFVTCDASPPDPQTAVDSWTSPLIDAIKFFASYFVPFSLRWIPLAFNDELGMVLFEMNSHSLWRQKDCRILLTSGIFSLRLFLSVRVVRPETTTCTLRMACTDFLGEINDLLGNFSCLEDVKRARPSVDNKLIALSP